MNAPVSASSLSFRWTYGVFLSFRGEEGAHRSFADNLYAKLREKGILTVQDGEEFEGEYLFSTIKKSRFTIIILSRNYATSPWCLEKLGRIVRFIDNQWHRHLQANERTTIWPILPTILPIFYDVDRSDVEKQTGSFAQAFTKHEELCEMNIEFWRAALRKVANLFGWSLKDRHESERIQIQEIVSVISYKLSPIFSSELVGIDSSVEELIPSYLGHGDHVYMIGICGTGGLGKTTLAGVIYDMFCKNFEGSSFIPDVREDSEKYGLPQLQQQLLVEILKKRNIEIRDVVVGVDMIRRRLCDKKVLIVLDDVDKLDQLKALAGEHHWFGRGSWIIITTRYEHLLVQYGVNKIYNLSELNGHDALKLFCLKAIKKEQPLGGYKQLFQDIVGYANSLPLALVTLGSHLNDKSITGFESTLVSLERIRGREILKVLKVSYNGLSEMEKEIFLDVACFFSGQPEDRAIKILNDCGFGVRTNIDVLINKFLICIENQKLRMHHLLQDLGREIVCQELEPGKRSRLWLCEDLTHVLTKDKATKAIQAIVLNSYYAWEKVEAFPEPFSKMDNLRLLMIRDVIPNGLNHVPDELIYFPKKNLVRFNLEAKQIEYLWEGVKYLDKMKYIDLRDSKSLIETPDFTGVPRLGKLWLSGCSKLVEIHPSIGQLRRLVELDLKDCKNLKCLPSNMDSWSLEILVLSGCSKLANLPETVWKMKCLKKLYLNEMPRLEGIGFNGISSFSSLQYLTLSRNRSVSLPRSISQLSNLETLDLSNCYYLPSLPELPSTVKYINAQECYSLQPVKYINAQECYSLRPSHNGGRYDESSGRVAYTILHRYLQGLLCRKTGNETSTKRTQNKYRIEFQIIIPGNSIPPWLTYQRSSNSIRIGLPPNWCNSTWMGFALCARMDGNDSFHGLGASVRAINLWGDIYFASEIFGPIFGSGQICLKYLSRDNWFARVPNGECSEIEVVFNNRVSLKALECGVRLVYEQEVEEFNQTIAQCGSNNTD